jgi:hypothetical protein
MKMTEEDIQQQIEEELIDYLAECKNLMKNLGYSAQDYDPSIAEVVDFALAQNILTLSKSINDVLKSDGKLHLNKVYLSGLRVFSDLMSNLKKNSNELPKEPLDDPLQRLRKSITILDVKE